MTYIVQKFGGTSVADLDRIQHQKGKIHHYAQKDLLYFQYSMAQYLPNMK